MSDNVYYAIGDIHGEAEKLAALYDVIDDDRARNGAVSKIVHLGDLIDRGPDSRRVIEMAMARTVAGEAHTVAGNHEELMLTAYDRPDTAGVYHWASNGGDETIASYRAANGDKENWRDSIDADHLTWLRALPIHLHDRGRNILFVHAGIDPRRYPECPDEVKLWTRSPIFYNPARWPDRPELKGLVVVHGHTPTDDFEPDVRVNRINVDTGACFGGPLTCVVLAPDEKPRFLRVA